MVSIIQNESAFCGLFYYKNYDFEFKQLDENKIDGRNEKFPMVILRLSFRLRHFWEIKCHNIKSNMGYSVGNLFCTTIYKFVRKDSTRVIDNY